LGKHTIHGHPLIADHTCIESRVACLQIVGLLIYFFLFKPFIAALLAKEDKVFVEQYSVTYLELEFKAWKCIHSEKMAHPLQAVKLLNYPADLLP